MEFKRPLTLAQRRQTSLSDEIRDLFVLQLQHELKNFTLYNSFSVYYSVHGLEKLGKYYKARADEELKHQQWIMAYLSDCDAYFEYPSIPINDNEKVNDNVTPFRLTVDREIETTEMINHIADTAFNQGDWATLSFLMGNYNAAKLIPEQIEEESLSRTALDIMETDDHILKKEDQIYDLYFNKKD
ncbi:MAG: hypothetical protein LIP09_03740 [Bacteroidales bacterium]|nr:hypothetical protein [Bacteroidales bacterium]